MHTRQLHEADASPQFDLLEVKVDQSRPLIRRRSAGIALAALLVSASVGACEADTSAARCYSFPVGIEDREGNRMNNVRDAGLVILKDYLGATSESLDDEDTTVEGLDDVVSDNIKIIAEHRGTGAYPTDIVGMKVAFNTLPFLNNGGKIEPWLQETTAIDMIDDPRVRTEVFQNDCSTGKKIDTVQMMPLANTTVK